VPKAPNVLHTLVLWKERCFE